jgi:Ca2+-binding EF-hand superfamily protein
MKPWIVALALTLAVPVASHAAERDPARGFKTLDTDGDGRISYAEYKTASQKRIDRFVARHPDGKLAAATPEQREVMIKARFDTIDANHDGAIDETEWTNRPRPARQDQPRNNS